jgi:hypoxanthine phosphoribosyltransferase
MEFQRDTVKLHNKYFKPFISDKEIHKAVLAIAEKLNNDFSYKTPILLGVLNGCFMFASDLVKELRISCEVSFVKLASYQGTQSSGEIKSLIGLNENLKGRDVIILEDIVDTGHTIDVLCEQLKSLDVNSITVVAFLFKPKAYKGKSIINYTGIEVGNEFLVGYGLDYDGLGRNLKDLYIIID